MEISYTFDVMATPSTMAPNRQLYCFDDCEVIDLPRGAVLLLGRLSRRRLIVRRDVHIALQHCAVFRSLGGHADHLLRTMPELGGNRSDVERVLESIRDAGLLVDADVVCARFTTTPILSQADALTVAVVTSDRPAALARLLESMLQQPDLRVAQHILVIDDSDDPAHVALNRAHIEAAQARGLAGICHVDPALQQVLAASLIQQDPSTASAVRFLLGARQWPTLARHGLARNWALLLSGGERLVMIDDDTLCRTVAPPLDGAVLGFASETRAAFHYQDEAQWPEAPAVMGSNPITCMAAYIGQPLGAVLALLGIAALTPEHLQGAALSELMQLSSATSLLATACGYLGDPGTGPAGDWLVGLPAASLDRLLARPERLPDALVSRNFWLGRTANTVVDTLVMSGVTGLDNRALLPPYFPVLRGEDLLFGHLLRLLHPNARVLDCGWAVPHLPMEDRDHLAATVPTVPGVGLGLLEPALQALATSLHGDPECRLVLVADALCALADRPTDQLIAESETTLLRQRAAGLRELDFRLRERPDAPKVWRDYLEAGTHAHSAALETAGLVSQMSAPPVATDEELVARFREWTRSYADALRCWPTLRRCAPLLRASIDAATGHS
jgi:hypothetical protein